MKLANKENKTETIGSLFFTCQWIEEKWFFIWSIDDY